MKKNIKPKNAGFTLMEALIAAMILIVVSAGVVVLTFLNLRNAVINKHRLQATWLAQQGIEGLRQIRDTHWIDQNPNNYWDTDAVGSNKSIVSGINQGLIYNSDTGGWKIYENSPNYFLDTLVLSDESDYFYTRTIDISYPDIINNPNIIIVKVSVTWDDYGHDRNATIQTKLTNWKKY